MALSPRWPHGLLPQAVRRNATCARAPLAEVGRVLAQGGDSPQAFVSAYYARGLSHRMLLGREGTLS